MVVFAGGETLIASSENQTVKQLILGLVAKLRRFVFEVVASIWISLRMT